MSHQPTLMLVHAHPDDETFATGGTIARYSRAGVRVVNVTCTGGERGEIVDPELATPENFADLGAIRQGELAMANEILGVSDQEYLGYCNSGMAGTASNLEPSCFMQATIDESTERLVRLIRRYRPQVLVSYDENGTYGHPDHIRAHEITVAAFAAAGDPNSYPETGAAWQPTKLYYVGQPRERMIGLWRRRQALGQPSPLDNPDFDPQTRGIDDARITTALDVAEFVPLKVAALRAHRTQVKPDHMLLQGDPLAAEYLGQEFFVLAQGPQPAQTPETDLFENIAQ